jgi:hypothetical protein
VQPPNINCYRNFSPNKFRCVQIAGVRPAREPPVDYESRDGLRRANGADINGWRFCFVPGRGAALPAHFDTDCAGMLIETVAEAAVIEHVKPHERSEPHRV